MTFLFYFDIIPLEVNHDNNLVSVTMFNQGQASKIFNRLHDEKQIVVLKNNVPTAVLLSPDEYDRLLSLAEKGEKKQ